MVSSTVDDISNLTALTSDTGTLTITAGTLVSSSLDSARGYATINVNSNAAHEITFAQDYLFNSSGTITISFSSTLGVTVSGDDDNETGFLAAARMASAATEQEVSILFNARGVTHVALPLWDPMLDQLVRIGRAIPAGQPLPPAAFSVGLRQWDYPLWLRPMNYVIPNDAAFQGFELRAFALGPEQSQELALSRLADFFLERGLKLEARAVREALKSFPRDVADRKSVV